MNNRKDNKPSKTALIASAALMGLSSMITPLSVEAEAIDISTKEPVSTVSSLISNNNSLEKYINSSKSIETKLGKNIIKNGSFETNPLNKNGWTICNYNGGNTNKANFIWDAKEHRGSGKGHSAKIVGDSKDQYIFQTFTPIEAGGKYTLSLYYKNKSGNPSISVCQEYRVGKAAVPINGTFEYLPLSSSTTWKKASITFDAKTDADNLHLSLCFSGKGSVWFDSVSLKKHIDTGTSTQTPTLTPTPTVTPTLTPTPSPTPTVAPTPIPTIAPTPIPTLAPPIITSAPQPTINVCSGCSTACSAGCSTGCSSSCSGSCSSGCLGSCSTSCNFSCKGSCNTSCLGSCDTSCLGGCDNYCRGGCSGTSTCSFGHCYYSY